MAQRKGALAKDPTLPATSKRGNWQFNGKWVNQQGFLVDNYGKVLPNQKKAFVPANRNPFAKAATPPPATNNQGGATQQDLTQQGFQGAGQAYQDLLNRFQNSDPYQMQQQYNPAFTQEMDRQRQNIMDTFSRRNAEEFQRQDIATEQQILERGLDPASPAAEAIRKANTQRQDLARQEAMSAGETAALGAQQQYYNQAYQTAMAPYTQWESIQQPYTTGIASQYQQQQLQSQQAFERAQQRAQLASAERIARMRGAGGGGGGQQGFDMNAWYDQQAQSGWGQQQQQTVNPVAAGTQGFVAGVGQGITNRK